MSEIFKKAAGLTPSEILVLSLLGGAGGFAGMRTFQEAMQKIQGQPQKPKSNAVELQLQDPLKASSPNASEMGGVGMPQMGKVATDWADWWGMPALAVGVGVPAGFLGTKGLYDHYQQGQNKKQVDEAKQQYMLALQAAQQANAKMASATPSIDGFCDELAKQANTVPTELNPPDQTAGESLLKVPPNFAHYLFNRLSQVSPAMFGGQDSTIPGVSNLAVMDKAQQNPEIMAKARELTANNAAAGMSQARDAVTGGSADQVKKTWLAIALGTSALAGGMGINAYNKKKEKEQKALYPTSIAYANQ
jgi:hypothetical protein